jgi:predicted nucleic acid-binding protein
VRLVIEASVAVQWYVEEEYSDIAIRISHDASEMHVPNFFYQEVTNAFWRRARSGDIDAAIVPLWLDSLTDATTIVHDSRSLVHSAWQIASGTAMPIYDAGYLAVALAQKCPVVTADRAFFRQARVSGHAALVRWIDDPNLLSAS